MYKDYGKVVVRKPLFEYDILFTTEGDTRPLEELVTQKITDPLFLEGVYWSSPHVYEQVVRYKEESLPAEKKQRLFHTLQKYLIRAATRCTPYGIFAGCSLMEIEGATAVVSKKGYRKGRVDMGLLYHVVQAIANERAFLPWFSYQLNSSLYPLGKGYRYVEAVTSDGRIEYQITSVDRTDLLDELVQALGGKMFRFKDVDRLIGGEVAYEDKRMFFEELVESQLIISEVYTALTAVDPLQKIEKVLTQMSKHLPQEVHPYLSTIRTLQQGVTAINNTALGELPLPAIRKSLRALEALGISLKEQHLFQVDLWQETNGEAFPKRAVKDIQMGIEVLARLTSVDSVQELHLKRFKELFKEKYGDREVPLTEAVDMEQGIGFPAQINLGNVAHNDLIDGLRIGYGQTNGFTVEKSQGLFDSWLEDKVREAQELGNSEIEVSKNEVEAFESQLDKLAPQINVLGALLPKGDILLHSVGGANAFSLTGRFVYLNTQLRDWCVQDIANVVNKEEVIHAEIVHFPEGRIANIARKTGLLPYQIPCLTYHDIDEESTLPLSDLMLSIRGDSLVLRSKKENKRVKPYLTHAHNYMRSDIPLYRFLACMQHQGRPGVQIHWGSWARRLRFFPRVRTGRVVLQRAMWQIFDTDINTISNAPDPIKLLKECLKRWGVPKLVCIQEGDNELFIDIGQKDYLSLLLEEMKRKRQLKLVEWLYEESSGSKENTHVQQFVIPLQAKQRKGKDTLLHNDRKNHSDVHNFVPGSEWLYFKLYCGAYIADELLSQIIRPCIEQLLANNIIDRAFFIRYNDPHYHIRFRLHLSNKNDVNGLAEAMALLHSLAAPYLNDGRIWKMQLDTYQREIDRYGIAMMEASEEAFYADSMAFLHLLEDERFREDADYRFYMGLQNVDNWLSLFDMPLDKRVSFCEEMAGAFGQEFDKSVGRRIDERYRSRRADAIDVPDIADSLGPLHTRSAKLEGLKLSERNLPSYIHMSINRWFNTEQRLMEYMIYRYSEKHYKFHKSLV